MAAKHYITAQQLLDDAYQLGLAIHDSGFKPDLIIGLWRGGAPVAIAIHELLAYLGCDADHVPLRTSLYRGVQERAAEVSIDGFEYCIDGLKYFVDNGTPAGNILVVDDVFDTGLTARAVLAQLKERCAAHADIRMATLWFKPDNNQTSLTPDYYLHQTSAWLVFPHELSGLSSAELANKPGIDALRTRLTSDVTGDR